MSSATNATGDPAVAASRPATPTTPQPPRSGDTVLIDRRASVQFAASMPFRMRIIRVEDRPIGDGWVWLDGYQLDEDGSAVERRSIFARLDGLRIVIDSPGRMPSRGVRARTRAYPMAS